MRNMVITKPLEINDKDLEVAFLDKMLDLRFFEDCKIIKI